MSDEMQLPEMKAQPGTETVNQERSKRKVREMQLDAVDTDKIDEIILSGRVQNGGKVRVERRGPMDQEYYYLCTVPASELTNTESFLERMKKLFGGGDYWCQAFRADGKMHGKFEFKIDHRFNGKLDEDRIRAQSGLVEKSVSDFIEKINAPTVKKEDMMALVEKLDQNSSGKNDSNMRMMAMMLKSMEIQSQQNAAMNTAIMNALASALSGKNAINSENVVLEMVRKSTERTPISDVLAMMKQLRELNSAGEDDLPPEKDEESDMMKIFKIAGPILASITQGAPRPPAPAGATVSAPPPTPPQLPPDGIASILPLMIAKIIQAAERNSDPSLYADLILDQLSPDQTQTLRGLLTPPDWCAKIGLDERMVAHVRPWLEELRGLILNGSTADIPGGAPGGPNAGGPPAAGPQPAGPNPNPGVDGSGGPAKQG